MLREASKEVITPDQNYTFAIDDSGDPYYGQNDTKADDIKSRSRVEASILPSGIVKVFRCSRVKADVGKARSLGLQVWYGSTTRPAWKSASTVMEMACEMSHRIVNETVTRHIYTTRMKKQIDQRIRDVLKPLRINRRRGGTIP